MLQFLKTLKKYTHTRVTMRMKLSCMVRLLD